MACAGGGYADLRFAVLARGFAFVFVAVPPLTIRTPVLLLWGELDRAVPASHAADYQRVLPAARAVVLPGLGHVPMEEAPAVSAAALRAFLEE